MDERTKELVAMGAGAAVNCRPCMEFHLEQSRQAGASEEDIRQAVDVGLQVNRGAAAKTRDYVASLLPTSAEATTSSDCC